MVLLPDPLSPVLVRTTRGQRRWKPNIVPRAHERDRLAGLDGQVEVVEDWSIGAVWVEEEEPGEGDLSFQTALDSLPLLRRGIDCWRSGQGVEHIDRRSFAQIDVCEPWPHQTKERNAQNDSIDAALRRKRSSEK